MTRLIQYKNPMTLEESGFATDIYVIEIGDDVVYILENALLSGRDYFGFDLRQKVPLYGDEEFYIRDDVLYLDLHGKKNFLVYDTDEVTEVDNNLHLKLKSKGNVVIIDANTYIKGRSGTVVVNPGIEPISVSVSEPECSTKHEEKENKKEVKDSTEEESSSSSEEGNILDFCFQQ